MVDFTDAKLLRVYVGEFDTYESQPLHRWLMEEAQRLGLAGGTALRGMEGFGAHHQLHTNKILELSTNLPIILEFVDSAEKIDLFLPIVDRVVEEGIVTLERVEARFYRGKST